MKPKLRKAVAAGAVLAGGAVIYFEWGLAEGAGEKGFWMLIGGLAVILGMIELIAGSSQQK
ncbi:MAG: hypothetical protein IT446_15490 [Phycisphaerales bacterium]|jgi:hypothetical protein|nr:hypothetical protein [Phycisphaerales bacterium]